MRRLLLAALLVTAVCTPRAVRREAPPLANEGELSVYVQPFPEQARRLSMTVGGLAAGTPGGDVPIQLAGGSPATLSGAGVQHQRLLARGRLPPGQYGSLALGVSKASIEGEEGPSALLAPEAPLRLPVSFMIQRGKGTVLWLSVGSLDALQGSFALGPELLHAQEAPRTVPQLVGFVTREDESLATVFDKHTRFATGVLATGRAPSSVVLEPDGTRAYFALKREDAVMVLDVASGTVLQRIRLRPGDGPRELALVGDGRTLLVVNELSNTVAWVDTVTFAEVARVTTGEEPWTVVVDRTRRRGFTLNRRTGTLSVLDLATRSVVRTLTTDPSPVRAAIDRQNTRLYVVSEGSPYLSVYTLPNLTLESRLYVGLGAQLVIVDPRSDLVYVARGDEGRILVFDPIALVSVDALDVPGPVAFMAIDDTENVLFLLIPSRESLVALDLTSRRTLATVDTGSSPSRFAMTGERH